MGFIAARATGAGGDQRQSGKNNGGNDGAHRRGRRLETIVRIEIGRVTPQTSL